MMRRVLLAFLTLPAVAAAQSYQMAGSLLRISSATYSRGTFGTGAGELLQRFDADDLTGRDRDRGRPGCRLRAPARTSEVMTTSRQEPMPTAGPGATLSPFARQPKTL